MAFGMVKLWLSSRPVDQNPVLGIFFGQRLQSVAVRRECGEKYYACERISALASPRSGS
jgi:hypothetical protein